MLDSLKHNNKTVGLKQTLKAVENGSVKTVFIAKDADPKVLHALKELCQKKSVEIIHVENMKVLGKACGIEVGAAAAGLLNKS